MKMALLRRLTPTLLEPISQIISNSRKSSTIVRQVQLLPVLRPSKLHPQGKIQLCKWRSGNYAGRYTGIIETVPELEVLVDAKVEIGLYDDSVKATRFKDFASGLLPAHLNRHLKYLELCAVLTFDGPPETEELIFISTLKDHEIESIVDDQNLPFTPEWFDVDKIPYQKMPADDFHWYPKVLSGQKVIGSFVFGGITELTIKSFHLEQVSQF